MKTFYHLMCILTIVGALAAQGQEASPDARVTARATIAKAKIAITNFRGNNEEFRSLCKRQEAGIEPLGEKEKERLTQIRSERTAFLDLNRQVVGLLKVGESVFTYPGLLALSEVDFNERNNKYSLRLVIAYKGYEGGIERHPTYRIIEFDEDGRITAIKDFATVNMVTE